MTKRKLWAKVRELENRVAAIDFRQRAGRQEVLVSQSWVGDHYEWSVEFLDILGRHVRKAVASAERRSDRDVQAVWRDGEWYVEIWCADDLVDVRKVLPNAGAIIYTDKDLYLNCYYKEIFFKRRKEENE